MGNASLHCIHGIVSMDSVNELKVKPRWLVGRVMEVEIEGDTMTSLSTDQRFKLSINKAEHKLN